MVPCRSRLLAANIVSPAAALTLKAGLCLSYCGPAPSLRKMSENTKFAALPGLALVTAGSLADPSVFKPQAVLYTSQGHAWDHLNPELPKFEKLWPGD
jgi:hypothetical protein